jgi:hypothetical protein
MTYHAPRLADDARTAAAAIFAPYYTPEPRRTPQPRDGEALQALDQMYAYHEG